jgi:hypothetical protein
MKKKECGVSSRKTLLQNVFLNRNPTYGKIILKAVIGKNSLITAHGILDLAHTAGFSFNARLKNVKMTLYEENESNWNSNFLTFYL